MKNIISLVTVGIFLAVTSSSCIPKRRGFSDQTSPEVTVTLFGLGPNEVAKDSSKVALTSCQSSELAGSLKSSSVALFPQVPLMPSGTTCTLEISDLDPNTASSSVRWIDKRGLRYRDEYVVISKNGDQTRTGQARKLTRMFDTIIPTSSVSIQLTTTVKRSEDISLEGDMDAVITCSPKAPYLAKISPEKFGKNGDPLLGTVIFTLPGSLENDISFKCNRMLVFRDRTIVADAKLKNTETIEVAAGKTTAEAKSIFEWQLIDLSSNDTTISPEITRTEKEDP